MKKLITLLTIVAVGASVFASEHEPKEPREKPTPEKPAPEKSCAEKRAEKEKQCEKLGSGMAANACKEAAKHEERNCEAAKASEQSRREPHEPHEPHTKNG